MDPAANNNYHNIDVKILSAFIHELNITRRYSHSYPYDHPIITNSASKVIQKLEILLEFQPALTLGIARNVLIFNSGVFDRKNPVYSDFACYLFAHGIATITFSRNISEQELILLFKTLGSSCETVLDRGGVIRQLNVAGIVNIQVNEVDYSSFRITEEDEIIAPGNIVIEHEAEALWNRFVEGLMQGNLDSGGKGITSTGRIDPERLAVFINQRVSQLANSTESSYDAAITSFMRKMDRDGLASRYDAESIRKLGEFVKNLTPELRRQFLQCSFDSLQGGDTTKKLLSQFPDEVILDALNDVNDKGSHLSQGVVNLLQIIARTGNKTGQTQKTAAVSGLTSEELSQKLKNIFREDEPSRYITDSYSTTLKTIASIERFSVLAADETQALSEQIRSLPIESKVSDVILQIMDAELESEDAQVLQDNLMDLCEVFLNTGDFRSLAKVHMHIRIKCQGGTFGILPIHETVFDRFMEPEFHEEILNGLAAWGKTKYEEIRAVIVGVGEPFVELLMLRLTEESSLSLRHFYLECLFEIGDASKQAAILNLNDKRWYVVRNMVILLRRFGDPVVLRYFRTIAEHSHPKVRQEVIRTLFAYNHPETDNLLQKEFKSSNHAILLAAIQLAEQSRNPGTFECLRKILAIKLFATAEYELKQAAVKTLGKIANPAILPDLEQILNQKSIFAATLHKRLKSDIVRSLENYPRSVVIPLLEKLKRSGSGELSLAATDVQKKLEACSS